MKILMTARFIAPSGVARSTREIAGEFRRFCPNDQMVLYAFGTETGNTSDQNVQVRLVETSEDSVRTPIRGLTSVSELRARYNAQGRAVAKLLDDVQPDLVVFNGTNVHDWLLLQELGGAKTPRVVVMHSSFTERLGYIDTPPQRLQAHLETDIVGGSNGFIFVSPLVRDLFHARYEIVPSSSVVIPNGIPDLFFSSKSDRTDEFDVAFIGRDDPVKNLSFFGHLSANPEVRGKYRIAVLTDFSYHRSLIPELTKNGVVLLPPTTEDHVLAEVYRKMRMVVSPSQFETLGLVPLEALACGSAAVVSTGMGAAHYFRHLGLDDWIVDFSNTERAIARVTELLRSEPRMPESTRDHLQREFAWSATAKRFIQFFKSNAIENCDEIAA